jgi:hypothetical protein
MRGSGAPGCMKASKASSRKVRMDPPSTMGNAQQIRIAEQQRKCILPVSSAAIMIRFRRKPLL